MVATKDFQMETNSWFLVFVFFSIGLGDFSRACHALSCHSPFVKWELGSKELRESEESWSNNCFKVRRLSWPWKFRVRLISLFYFPRFSSRFLQVGLDYTFSFLLFSFCFFVFVSALVLFWFQLVSHSPFSFSVHSSFILECSLYYPFLHLILFYFVTIKSSLLVVFTVSFIDSFCS